MLPSSSPQSSNIGLHDFRLPDMLRNDARRLPDPPSYDSLFGAEGSEWQGINHEGIETISRDLLTFPEDVVSQIFAHACQPIVDSTHDINPAWKRTFHPLWLGKISRAWRDCAWRSSELWTTIIINVPPQNVDTQTELLQEWIERAKRRPLDVYVGELAHPSDGLLSLLSKHSEQWQHINFCLPSKGYQHLSSEPLCLPTLRRASLVHSNKFDIEREQQLELDLNDAPLLRILSLSRFSFGPRTLTLYPTKKITHLTLSSSPDVNLRLLLGQFCNLKEFTFAKCALSFERSTDLPPTPHNRLTILNVEFDTYAYLDLFFRQVSRLGLSLPALRGLSIRMDKPVIYTNSIPVFLEHSGCALTQLTIECQITAEYTLINFLSSSSISTSLTELHIHYFGYGMYEARSPGNEARLGLSRTFFDNLHPDKDPDYLQSLEILEYEGPLAVHAIDFLEPLIIRSRRRSISSSSSLDGTVILKQVTIKADQVSEIADFSIAEYPDPQYVWEVSMMMEEGVFSLTNRDGSMWR